MTDLGTRPIDHKRTPLKSIWCALSLQPAVTMTY